MKISKTIKITGEAKQVTAKTNALNTLANQLDLKTLVALANVVKNDPQKVQLAKNFLGV